jgi:hypothetical protein
LPQRKRNPKAGETERERERERKREIRRRESKGNLYNTRYEERN